MKLTAFFRCVPIIQNPIKRSFTGRVLPFQLLDFVCDLVADGDHFGPDRHGPFHGRFTMSQLGGNGIGELHVAEESVDRSFETSFVIVAFGHRGGKVLQGLLA